MLEYLIVAVIGLVLAVSAEFVIVIRAKKDLKEYKELFKTADGLQKTEAAKVVTLLEISEARDSVLERSSQALGLANSKLVDYKALDIKKDVEISGLHATVEFQEEQYKKLFSQKKSSEVRTGKITEQISPFLSDYPLSPSTARFIGDPIDFVHFDEDKVSFVEVKSGKSQLTKKQRHIRDLIKDGKVEFIIYRVEGK